MGAQDDEHSNSQSERFLALMRDVEQSRQLRHSSGQSWTSCPWDELNNGGRVIGDRVRIGTDIRL